MSIFVLLLGDLSGCKQHSAEQDVNQLVAQLEKGALAKQRKVEAAQIITPVIYQGDNQRDPFEIPVLVQRDTQHPDTLLRNIALDSLKLVGVIMHHDQRWAVFRATDGKVYRVEEGARVGLQHALLTRVMENQVIFKLSTSATQSNEMKDQEMVMRLQQQEPAK